MVMTFRQRLAQLRGLPNITYVEQKIRWTPGFRLQCALANDNKGIWWTCLSTRSVADLQLRMLNGMVAGVLYDVVGGILGDHRKLKHTGRKHYLYIQLVRRDEWIDLSLREQGIEPVSRIAFSEIRWY